MSFVLFLLQLKEGIFSQNKKMCKCNCMTASAPLRCILVLLLNGHAKNLVLEIKIKTKTNIDFTLRHQVYLKMKSIEIEILNFKGKIKNILLNTTKVQNMQVRMEAQFCQDKND